MTGRTLAISVLLFGFTAVLAFAGPATLPSSRPADVPGVEKQDLFEARTAGYTVYRIPGIIVTGRGTLLAYCEARKEHGWDWDPIDVLLRRSNDGGRTWDGPRPVAEAPADARPNPAAIAFKRAGNWVTLNNPVMIAGAGGTVHFLYCVNYGRCFYRRSDDDGATFAAPVEITATFEKFRPEYNWLVIGPGPGHGIRLSARAHAGRLVVPVWLSLGTAGNGHHPSSTATVFSDDDGKTWERGDFFARSTPPGIIDPSETAAVELSDGRVMLNTRTDSPGNRRLFTIGPDGATHWSEPAYDPALFDPVCFASLVRLRADPDHHSSGRIVFANPDSSGSNWKSAMKPRRNLTLRLSEDDGNTWPMAKVLEPEVAAYSDLAVGADGTIYCLYERGGMNDMFDTQFLTLARIPADWLGAGSATKKSVR